LIFEIVFFFIVTENSAVRDTFCICVAGESTMRLFLPYLLVCYINVAICNEEKCIILIQISVDFSQNVVQFK
jgi:hypothetical protein